MSAVIRGLVTLIAVRDNTELIRDQCSVESDAHTPIALYGQRDEVLREMLKALKDPCVGRMIESASAMVIF